jgi:hypothetical protein
MPLAPQGTRQLPSMQARSPGLEPHSASLVHELGALPQKLWMHAPAKP